MGPRPVRNRALGGDGTETCGRCSSQPGLLDPPMLLVVEQILNGLQFGLLLFLLAAGLTLVFGIMDFVNLAHGSLYMMGAYFAATFFLWTGNFLFSAALALGAESRKLPVQ